MSKRTSLTEKDDGTTFVVHLLGYILGVVALIGLINSCDPVDHHRLPPDVEQCWDGVGGDTAC